MAPARKPTKAGASLTTSAVSIPTATEATSKAAPPPPSTDAKKKAVSAAAAKKESAAAAKKSAAAGVVLATKTVEKVDKKTDEKAAATGKAQGAKKAKHDKKSADKADTVVAPYKVLLLRNLPENFQEAELTKFYSQFGPKITRLYVLRVKKTRRSRGIAYIRFADNAKEDELEALFDETDGIILGGQTISAKWTMLKKPMPNAKKILLNRKIDFANRTRGVRLMRKKAKKMHKALVSAGTDYVGVTRSGKKSLAPGGVVQPSSSKRKRDVVETGVAGSSVTGAASATTTAPEAAPALTAAAVAVVKADALRSAYARLKAFAESEKKANAHFAKMGIAYSFDGFSSQLKRFEPVCQAAIAATAVKKA